MTDASPLVTKKSLGMAGLAAFGVCALCCALPVLAAAGIGGGVVSTLAAWIKPGADLVLAGVVGAGVVGVTAWRARRQRVSACATACDIAGSCGCAPDDDTSILSTPTPRSDAPVVCTADLSDKPTVQAQLDGYRVAFEQLLRVERFPHGVRWVFPNRPRLVDHLRNLAENEHRCCAFFKFDLRAAGETIIWETRANEGAAAVLEEYARLPELLRQHPRGHETLPIKAASEHAGLVFAADTPSTKW